MVEDEEETQGWGGGGRRRGEWPMLLSPISPWLTDHFCVCVCVCSWFVFPNSLVQWFLHCLADDFHSYSSKHSKHNSVVDIRVSHSLPDSDLFSGKNIGFC